MQISKATLQATPGDDAIIEVTFQNEKHITYFMSTHHQLYVWTSCPHWPFPEALCLFHLSLQVFPVCFFTPLVCARCDITSCKSKSHSRRSQNLHQRHRHADKAQHEINGSLIGRRSYSWDYRSKTLTIQFWCCWEVVFIRNSEITWVHCKYTNKT